MGGLVVSSMVAARPELYADDVILMSPVPTRVRKTETRAAGAVLGALQYRLGHRTGRVGKKLVKSKIISRATTRLLLKTNDTEQRKAIYGHHLRNLDYISDIKFYDTLHRDINRRGSIDYAETLRHKRVLLIAGDRDAVTPLNEITQFAHAVKPERFAIIHGVGHLIHYEQPEAAAEFISEFLRRR